MPPAPAASNTHASLLHGCGIDPASVHPSVQETIRAADHMLHVAQQKSAAGDHAGAAEAESLRQQYAAHLRLFAQQAQQAMYAGQMHQPQSAGPQGWTA